MEKKVHLLSNLKKQVQELKAQLEKMDKSTHDHKNGRKWVNHSSRFDSNISGSEYLDKGLKKFDKNIRYRNLSEVINEKSEPCKVLRLSPFRKTENQRTKENFSYSQVKQKTERSESPNPIMGSGYNDIVKGKKRVFEKVTPSSNKKETQRRHFSSFYY